MGPRERGQMWGTHTRAEPGNDFKSSNDNHQSSMESIGHHADFFFHLSGVHHGDGIPGAAVEEGAVRTLAGALIAADAQDGIHLDAAEGRVVLIRHPEHAVFHRAVFDAGGRTGATGAALGDNGQLFGLFLARSDYALGAGL